MYDGILFNLSARFWNKIFLTLHSIAPTINRGLKCKKDHSDQFKWISLKTAGETEKHNIQAKIYSIYHFYEIMKICILYSIFTFFVIISSFIQINSLWLLFGSRPFVFISWDAAEINDFFYFPSTPSRR